MINKFQILVFSITLFGFNIKAQDVNVDLNTKYQIIRGYGGIHIQSWTGREITPDMMEKAFDNNPGEMGLSIFRMQIAEDTNAWANELDIAKYAQAKGAIIFASPWNPPAYMRKVKGTFNNETDYVLLEEYYDDYAAHLNQFIDYMKNNGVDLYAVSIQNEPDWHGWTTWTAKQMSKFLKENSDAINCKIIAPESFGYNKIFIDSLLNDSIVNSKIDILGTHIYGTPKSGYYYPLANQKNKEIWMTEHLLGSENQAVNTWSLALQFAEEISTCMDANMSAYVYWYIRRFYGLIDDAGNITDKGYVLSHFSKFVRPGSYRVYSKLSSASNVFVNAFANDSVINVVIVNKNSTPVNLNFNIQNLIPGIDSLVKYTSSQAKKMVNDGILYLTNNQFSSSVDPLSITTFTSDFTKGGKFGNKAPVVKLMNDTLILDSIGKGIVYTLNCAQCYDIDGEITKYSWSKDGLQVSASAEYEAKLIPGTHTFVLSVVDNDGAVSFDTLNIEVKPAFNTEIWLEAECTQVNPIWNIISSTACSEGKCLTINPDYEANSAPSDNTDEYLTYSFYIGEKGNYKIWGRVLTPSANDDSYWIRVDNGDWINWNSIPANSSWAWDDVHNQSDDNAVIFYLDTGYHTLTICYRENGASIDKWYITNTGKIPSGYGRKAYNCLPTDVKTIVKNNFKLFPNPANSVLHIQGEIPFDFIRVNDLKGTVVFEQKLTAPKTMTTIQLNLSDGLYIVKVFSGGRFEALKLFVKR